MAKAKKKRTASRNPRSINAKQRLFAKEYLVDLNASAAYIRAGYSPHGAGQSAEKLLKNPEIDAFVRAGMATREERAERTAQDVVNELVKIAFADRRDVLKRGAVLTMQELDALPPDIVACIDSISVSRDGKRVRLKLVNKQRTLDMLMKHHGAYAAAKREHSGPEGGPIPLAGADGGPIQHEHSVRLPSPEALAGFLRDLGLPCGDGVRPDGGG